MFKSILKIKRLPRTRAISITSLNNIPADVRSRNPDDPNHNKREIRRRSCNARSLSIGFLLLLLLAAAAVVAAASLIVEVIRSLQKEQMHQAVLKNESIRDSGGVPGARLLGLFSVDYPQNVGVNVVL